MILFDLAVTESTNSQRRKRHVTVRGMRALLQVEDLHVDFKMCFFFQKDIAVLFIRARLTFTLWVV